MVKKKCKICGLKTGIRKGDIIWKLDKDGSKEHLHGYRVTSTEGGVLAVEMISEEKEPLAVREKMAGEIVAMIEPQLQAQVATMVKKSLSRYDLDRIKEVKKEIDKGKVPKLDSKPGCVFLQTSKGKIFL
jgi:hypothetical protein